MRERREAEEFFAGNFGNPSKFLFATKKDEDGDKKDDNDEVVGGDLSPTKAAALFIADREDEGAIDKCELFVPLLCHNLKSAKNQTVSNF